MTKYQRQVLLDELLDYVITVKYSLPWFNQI